MNQKNMEQLKERLEEMLLLLGHYSRTCQTMKEQMQNLLNLEFNTETVSQAQSVTRLNVLAFTFIPLSFVASIFGMTNFEVGPKWFPVMAIPLLLCTIILGLLAGRVVSAWESYKQSTGRQTQPMAVIPAVSQSTSHLVTSLHTNAAFSAPGEEKNWSEPKIQIPPGETDEAATQIPPRPAQIDAESIQASRQPIDNDTGISLVEEKVEKVRRPRSPVPVENESRVSKMRIYQRTSYAVSGDAFRSRMREVAGQSVPGARTGPSRFLAHTRRSQRTETQSREP